MSVTSPSALPYVAWSSATAAVVPADVWPLVFTTMQAFKGHVQEYPGCQKFEAFVEETANGIRIECYTTWDTPEQLEAFLERGYTVDRMLADAADIETEGTRVVEKVF